MYLSFVIGIHRDMLHRFIAFLYKPIYFKNTIIKFFCKNTYREMDVNSMIHIPNVYYKYRVYSFNREGCGAIQTTVYVLWVASNAKLTPM